MDTDTLLTHVRSVAEPLLAQRETELVELTIVPGRSPTLRFLVQTAQGITLDECAALNRALSEVLDTNGLLQGSYLLEVASPGLDRPLRTRRDFERVRGRSVTVDLVQPFAGRGQLVGEVRDADETAVMLETKRWGTVTLPLTNIRRAVVTLRW